MNGELRVVEDLPGAFCDLVSRELGGFAGSRSGRAFRLALSGGPTARACYEALALRDGLPWSEVEIFWGDERCVPPDDPDSNQRLGREALLSKVQAPSAVHPMQAVRKAQAVAEPGGGGPGEPDRPDASWYRGAEAYHALLSEAGPMDLIHLGCGPDGHTASLFPDSEALLEPRGRLAMVNLDPSGRNPHPRMTVTMAVIDASRLAVFTVAGESKRAVIARLRSGATLPAGLVGAARVVWLVDPVAAGEV